jgi:hypothetical protein
LKARNKIHSFLIAQRTNNQKIYFLHFMEETLRRSRCTFIICSKRKASPKAERSIYWIKRREALAKAAAAKVQKETF